MTLHASPRLAGIVSALAIAVATTTALPAQAQTGSYPAPQDFSEMVQAKLPSVVGIIAPGAAPDPVPGQRPQ